MATPDPAVLVEQLQLLVAHPSAYLSQSQVIVKLSRKATIILKKSLKKSPKMQLTALPNEVILQIIEYIAEGFSSTRWPTSRTLFNLALCSKMLSDLTIPILQRRFISSHWMKIIRFFRSVVRDEKATLRSRVKELTIYSFSITTREISLYVSSLWGTVLQPVYDRILP